MYHYAMEQVQFEALLKVVGLTLSSSLWKQITQTHLYLLTNNCRSRTVVELSKNCFQR